MKKVVFSLAALALFAATSCKKCHDCHYDGPSGEVEIGEFCGDELESIEEGGYAVGDTVYAVHCEEH